MAYNSAEVLRIDQNANGTATIILLLTGNAGEVPVELRHAVDISSPPSVNFMRGLAMQKIANLNATKDFVGTALPFVGTFLDITTPLPTDPPPTSTYGEYMAASDPFAIANSAQDVFTISGSATKIVRVLRWGIMTVQTSAGMNFWKALGRSTANTGGTSTTPTACRLDGSYPAATAVVRAYTANPTLGTLVGSVWAGRVPSPAPGSAPGGDLERAILGNRTSSIVLSGVGQSLAWNFNGVNPPAGLSVVATVHWSEI